MIIFKMQNNNIYILEFRNLHFFYPEVGSFITNIEINFSIFATGFFFTIKIIIIKAQGIKPLTVLPEERMWVHATALTCQFITFSNTDCLESDTLI